jgi:hypothetical protein
MISGVMEDFFKKAQSRELIRTIRWHEIKKTGRKLSAEQIRPLLHTHDNLIEYNEIHHAIESLGDGNGIYIRGAGPCNIIADILPATKDGKKTPSNYLKLPQTTSNYLKLREGPLTGGTIKGNIFYHTEGKPIFLDQGNNSRLPAAWAKEADTDYNTVKCWRKNRLVLVVGRSWKVRIRSDPTTTSEATV